MKTVLLPSPGTIFGRLTVIREARRPDGRRAMLCLCECGEQKIVRVSKLFSGHTKSCGCLLRSVIDLAKLRPGEVPLYGEKAAGRVALVDDGDYDLVMQYRWCVSEQAGTATRRPGGPYAKTNAIVNGRRGIRMHVLIMGHPYIDHIDHDGLNNRRSNLRPATEAQNARNTRSQLSARSQYKGVSWSMVAGKWQAGIQVAKRSRHLGFFTSEIEAACAYDAAAHEAFGEFACTNFPGDPARAVCERELEGRLF